MLAVGVALSATMITPVLAPLPAKAEEKKESAGFVEKMKQWQEKMSDKFRDAWKGWTGKKDQSVDAASVDLREQKDAYTLRLNLPKRDLSKVTVSLEGESLRIVAPPEGKVGRYEQVITLAKVSPSAKPQIERKPNDNLLVVTVPKSNSLAESKAAPAKSEGTHLGPLDDWDRDVFTRMEKMRREMDKIFADSLSGLDVGSDHNGLFDVPSFGSSVDLQDEGTNYVIRAYLPERNMSNINVTVEGDVLKVEAKAEGSQEKNEKGAVAVHKAQYAQMITLPGPVQSDKMKVEPKEGMVVITLPKA